MYKSSQSNYKPCTHTGIQSPILPLPHPMNHMWSSTRWSHPFVSQTQLMLCIIITMYSVFLFFPLLCQHFWKKWWKIWWMWAAKSKLELVGASGICGGNDIISNHMPWHQSEPCFWDSKFLFRISVQMRKALSAEHSNRWNVSSETEGATCGRIAAERWSNRWTMIN